MKEKNTQLYLPKGEWLNSMLAAFNRAGLEIKAQPRSYEYKFVSSTIPIVFEAIRSKEVWEDIIDPNTTANGGFTGTDIIKEQNIYTQCRWTFPLYELESNDIFPRPRIYLGSTPNCRDVIPNPEISDLKNKIIYTSYPRITQDFFTNRKISVEIVEKQGAIEGRWRTNINNWGIVDVVSSGKTLEANNIKIMEEIFTAEIDYIGGPNISCQDQSRVDDLREKLYLASKK